MLAQADGNGGDGGPATAVLLIVGLGLYFLPWIVAALRKVPNVGSVFVINAFLGWTLVGWVVALAMAARTVPVAHFPPSSLPPPPR